jgi:hypothetical protein
MRYSTTLVGLSLLITTAVGVEKPSGENDIQRPASFVIGISPYLDRGVKDDVYRGIVRLLVEDLPLGSSLAIYDAFDLKSITQVTLPNNRAFTSPKTRANQFASAVHDLKQFLGTEHPRPKQARLNFESAIRLPQFCDFLDENLSGRDHPLTVLLVGSPLYQDAKEPSFSMVDGYFPSDGHLQTSREQSVFGLSSQASSPRSLQVHWVYFGDPWVSELHKEKITRFWTLYLQWRAGQLATLTSDLPTALQAFCRASSDAPPTTKGWAVDPRQTKVEMLRISRSVDLSDWLTRDTLLEATPPPPSVMVGQMKIGIRWKHNIDLDLYATPHRGAETLFFQHTRSPEGYYNKDHRSSPGREYEFVEFGTPVDVRQVEAYANFYKGTCPGGPHGEVRIEFDGRIYSAPFSISAEEGNLGRSGSSQQEFWTRIPVQEILKITPAS